MDMAAAAPLISFMLAMLLIVSTGTAWFAALHPRFIGRFIQGNEDSNETDAGLYLSIRLGGMALGLIGVFLLFLGDVFA
ncbi:hypothetical protein [Cohnella candidum]|uniref:Uncharacterized protein n=1 Tax=Cohnella candidum TaxID=2674991 RepID=A0A3G3K210_9BACL|nr:hypothetical protein [Cohnella candidum]AYQ73799.1 hypothetical protein EAV92_15170 [Cohnella candidum]